MPARKVRFQLKFPLVRTTTLERGQASAVWAKIDINEDGVMHERTDFPLLRNKHKKYQEEDSLVITGQEWMVVSWSAGTMLFCPPPGVSPNEKSQKMRPLDKASFRRFVPDQWVLKHGDRLSLHWVMLG
jgi:hypothetical protein